jgi:hypothetical protein
LFIFKNQSLSENKQANSQQPVMSPCTQAKAISVAALSNSMSQSSSINTSTCNQQRTDKNFPAKDTQFTANLRTRTCKKTTAKNQSFRTKHNSSHKLIVTNTRPKYNLQKFQHNQIHHKPAQNPQVSQTINLTN